MEIKKTKEEMDKSKTELLNQLKEMNISSDNLDWVNEQLDQTINEEVERQNVPQMISTKMAAQQQLIKLLYSQVVDLTTMSKIELGDDVIAEIKRLQDIIGMTMY